MKRLFIIRQPNGKPVTRTETEFGKNLTLYFATKTAAKKLRNELGGPESGYTIALGPDHRRYTR